MIDTHSHIDSLEYRENFEEVLEDIRRNEVEKVIIPGCEPGGFERIINLCEKYDMLYGALGVHPEELDKLTPDYIDKIKEGLKRNEIKAIGEIGLDYHYCEETKAEQKKILRAQLEVAQEFQVPVLIHDREAHEDCFEILSDYELKTVVMHCFSGTAEFAQKCIEKGYYIGIGGVVTFKNAKDLKETTKIIPAERILLETDAPYLAPVPFRGKTNTPAYLKYIAQEIADLRGISIEEVKKQTTENAERIFNF